MSPAAHAATGHYRHPADHADRTDGFVGRRIGRSGGWRRWLAVAIGFVGVALVIQPSGQGINIYAISALLCAIFVAFRDLITRRLHDNIPTAIVTFGATLSVCVAGFAGAPFQEWQPISLYGGSLLAASAILVSVANMFVVRAFRGVDVSVVSPFGTQRSLGDFAGFLDLAAHPQRSGGCGHAHHCRDRPLHHASRGAAAES